MISKINCKRIKMKMKIKPTFMVLLDVEVSKSICLPKLRVLQLIKVRGMSDSGNSSLISNNPILEEVLIMERDFFYNMQRLSISSK